MSGGSWLRARQKCNESGRTTRNTASGCQATEPDPEDVFSLWMVARKFVRARSVGGYWRQQRVTIDTRLSAKYLPTPSPAAADEDLDNCMALVRSELLDNRNVFAKQMSKLTNELTSEATAQDDEEPIEARPVFHRPEWDAEYSRIVHNALADRAAYAKKREVQNLESRGYLKSNAQVTLRLVLLGRAGARFRLCLVDVPDSIPFNELVEAVRKRCGRRLSKCFRLLWLTSSGETVELALSNYRHFVTAQRLTQRAAAASVQPWALRPTQP